MASTDMSHVKTSTIVRVATVGARMGVVEGGENAVVNRVFAELRNRAEQGDNDAFLFITTHDLGHCAQ
jgi:hypothetical protein